MEINRTDEQILAGIVPRIRGTETFEVQHGMHHGNNIRQIQGMILAFVDDFPQAVRVKDALNEKARKRLKQIRIAYADEPV